MAVLVKNLAKKLDMTEKELKARCKTLGFDLEEKEIDDDTAELIEMELSDEERDTADVYDEMIAQQMDKEIVKSQRKQMAGKKSENRNQKSESIEFSKGRTIEIEDTISVKEFAEKAELSAAKVIGELMKNGILANINQQLDFETASVIAEELGLKLKRKRGSAAIEDIFRGNLEKLLAENDASVLKVRPPVVSVMGHVDHGKTMILDRIRETNVVAGEAGGITQHIGAYQVVVPSEKKELKGKIITFLDTPGHEAFTAMRARGAKTTDIAILVVAADEGVKPQTIESINHAREAGIPIIVAINKMDKENANPEKVKTELSQHGLQPENWGGDTVMVPVSAMTGDGITTLLEMILLTADMGELKGNPARPAVGTVIEADLDPSFGPVATVLVNTGTLRIMDNVIVGSTYGKVKAMIDHTGKRLKEIKPSGVARIAGLSETPRSGDILQVVGSEKEARTQAVTIKQMLKNEEFKKMGMGVNEIMMRIQEGSLKTLKLIVKTDTKGSLEAIKQSLDKIKSDDVAIKIVHSGVGAITESDVMMAAAGGGIVIGFHVDANAHVKKMAEREGVEVVIYKIIYELIDDIKKLLTGMLEPEIVINELGKATVKAIFFTGKKNMIIGCKVTEGIFEKDANLRVSRGEEQLGEGKIIALKVVSEDVTQVEAGNECGIKFDSKVKLEEGDVLEAYKEEKRIKTLG
ncbi:translation initiation factor IF-2 [Patescibacteria group bacterium]|nr:translation initiation factor IF-2 [Patescibacteria group bacterium]